MQQKAPNFMFCRTLTLGMGSIQSCEVKYNFFVGGSLIQLVWGSQDMPMQCNAML